MSSNTSRRFVCRLLGGSGRPQLFVVPPRRLPALLAPARPVLAKPEGTTLMLQLAA